MITYGTYVAMTVTNLQSLVADSTDPFTSWQSDRVDNQTSAKVDDYEVRVHLPTTANAPAGDSAAYIYVVPWVYNGSTWSAGGNFGTTTLPTGAEGAASVSDPNSMLGPVAVPYKITSQIMQAQFSIAQLFGGIVPDGWSLAIRTNNCAIAGGQGLTTGCVVEYRPITLS
jgi:hypothetical protein